MDNANGFRAKLSNGEVCLGTIVSCNDAAIPGVSALVIGSNDLSGSLGLVGQPRHPDVLRAIDKVIAAGKSVNMPVGIGIGNDAHIINEWIAKGMSWVAMGNEMSLMLTALSPTMSEVRGFVKRSASAQMGSGGSR
jgi:2-keto-3-deoxy-L-rhamnonate aldolase RhmA